jgi:hypothetical protein
LFFRHRLRRNSGFGTELPELVTLPSCSHRSPSKIGGGAIEALARTPLAVNRWCLRMDRRSGRSACVVAVRAKSGYIHSLTGLGVDRQSALRGDAPPGKIPHQPPEDHS